MSWLILSLIAMLCWSGSDLFSKAGSRQNDRYSHYKVGIAVGLIMGIHAIYSITLGGIPFSFSDIIAYLPASFFYILSMMLGYIALRYIELSISSPICNTSGAFALILSLCYFGVTWNAEDESGAIFLNAPIIFAVIMIIIGVVSLGIVEYFENDEARELRQQASGKKYTKSVIAILLPILYCVLDACGTFVDTTIAENHLENLTVSNSNLSADELETLSGDILNTAYEFTWFFMAIIFAIYVFVIRKQKIDTKFDGIKCLGGLCETAGQIFYMQVIVRVSTDPMAGFGLIIISAYCTLSFIWSRIFLKEKLSWRHYLAIAAVFVGILILGVYDA